MNQHFPVHLTETERHELQQLIAAGTASARKLMHARILLKADRRPDGPVWADQAVADAVSQSTIARVRKQAESDGVEAALN